MAIKIQYSDISDISVNNYNRTSSGWVIDNGENDNSVFTTYSSDAVTYKEQWSLADRFPFVIHKVSLYYNNNTKGLYESLSVAQYYQSKHFVEYGKSTKRVIKHAIKMRKFEEEYPEDLL